MEGQMTQGEQNLLLLQSLIPADEKFYVWCFDREGQFVATSCPQEERELLQRAFFLFDGLERIQSYGEDLAYTSPRIVGSPIGMEWALSYEKERERSLIFVIGPVFYASPREDQVKKELRPLIHGRERALWAGELIHFLPSLPVMSYPVFIRYVLMVHNTLTGQRLGLEALEETKPRGGEMEASPAGKRDRSQVYLAEKALLQMVREGDINYHKVLQNSISLSPGVPVKGTDPLRQAKISIQVFTTLVSRAAMEGGLSPEIAYSLGDSYIQAAEDLQDSGELSALAHAMYHDFVYRVHYVRVNPNYSHAIQKCCDYIALSLDGKIRTRDLASLVGYTEYYLTEKFKKETGVSVSAYIRQAKAERAKVLLETTTLSVREVAESLGFNTVNYFIQCFRTSTGETPAQYRIRIRGEREKSAQEIPT